MLWSYDSSWNSAGALTTEAAGESEILGLAVVGRAGSVVSHEVEVETTHMVTRLAWIAARLVSSKRETRYAVGGER